MTQFSPGFYRMRNGEKAEVFAERDGELWGRYNHCDDMWLPVAWGVNGSYADDTKFKYDQDLISPWEEPRVLVDGWVNIYPDSAGVFHPTKEEADEAAGEIRLGVAHHVREVIE